MGLDQYAYVVSRNEGNTDFKFVDNNDVTLIAEWRKHPNLQGWMEQLFNNKADIANYEGKRVKANDDDGVVAFQIINSETIDELNLDGIDKEVSEELKAFLEQATEMRRAMDALTNGNRDFNCQPVRLTEEDLDNLMHDITENNLPSTIGMFFGDNADAKYKIHDIEFIIKAKFAIKCGFDVYYYSWF